VVVRMVRLNFGPSNYDIDYKGGNAEYKVINVPKKGKLKKFPNSLLKDFNYLNKKENAKARRSILKTEKNNIRYVSVEFNLLCDPGKKFDLERKIIMSWVPSREEWIGIYYHRYKLSKLDNETYCGAFELNEYCQRKICEAYGILPLWVQIEKVNKIRPEHLEDVNEIC
jgi:hypothetical protein